MAKKRALLLVPLVLASACADAATGPAERASIKRAAAVSSPGVTVVMSGLNGPRGLDWSPDGALYVTESGTTKSTGACATVLEGTVLQTRCYSGTGSVSRLRKGRQERIATGLPSTFLVSSGATAGPQDISFAGGRAFVVLGLGADPAARAELGEAAARLGTLIQLQRSGEWRVVADVAGFEGSANPDGLVVYSNPFGVLAESPRRFVVDAGGNTLLEVGANGDIELLATFPRTAAPPPFGQAEAVPTKVSRGPDGALYVSTLSGVPFLDGAAAIYRVVPGQPPVPYATGFKTITDFAFAPDGGLYVLQFATGPVFFAGPGALIRVAPDGTRSVVAAALTQPTGLALGEDGSVYVSNRGTSSGGGEVLRIVP
jgi:DNA-binding beta-propeller fold protein YncE